MPSFGQFFNNPKNRLLLLLTSIQFVYTLDLMIIMPLGPFIMDSWNISASYFGVLIAAFAIAGGLSSFVGVFYIHKYNRHKFLSLIFSCFTIGLWFTAFSPNYISLLLSRILTGIFAGLLGALILTEISEQFEYSKRSKPVAVTTIALALASILGAPLGLYIANLYSWRAPFILLSILSSIISALIFLSKTVASNQKKDNSVDYGSIIGRFIKNQKPRSGLFLIITLVFSQYSIFIYLPPYLINNLGLTENQLSSLYLFGGLSIILAAPVIGILSDKYGKKTLFISLSLLLIIPLYSITSLDISSFEQIIIIAIFYFAFDGGRMIPESTLTSELITTNERVSYLSFRSSIKRISIGITALIGSLVIHTNPDDSLQNFNLLGIIALISLLLSVWVVFNIKISKQTKEP